MFGWFKRRREAHKADVEKRILAYGAEQARRRDVLRNATRPDVVPIEQVISTGNVSVKPTVRFTSPPREPVSSRPRRPHVTPSYTPSSVRDGYYQPSADLLTPAVVAAAVVDTGSSSSGWDAGSSSSSCSSDTSSSGCGGGGCGGGC